MTSPEEQLGLGYTVSRTPQVQGRLDEAKMAKQRGARLHPNSGAGHIKDDASDEDTIYEFKSVDRSHSLLGAELLALFQRAVRQYKNAEYVVYFKKADITATITLRRGKHG